LQRAAITYEEDQREPDRRIAPEALQRASEYGYLIGPYDTFNNIQNPATADCFESVFDRELFSNGGVMEAPGKVANGFHNRGHHLSSKALKMAPQHYFEQRVLARTSRGINAYFLDVDATGELYDDYDPRHQMSREEDRENRVERMKFIVDQGFVLGSESAAAWSVRYLHFSQGPFTPKSAALWSFVSNKERFGGYRPWLRPDIHFKEVDAPADLVTLAFDPRFRLPLYETVFHDSLIATDWAGLSLMKLRNVAQVRSLLACLYNVPTLWRLDDIALESYGERLRALDAFWGPMHRAFGAAQLTDFRYLTPDRLVQETRFGTLVLVANFGDRPYQRLAPLCVHASWEGHAAQFCPKP
jgi:hypothetical protein